MIGRHSQTLITGVGFISHYFKAYNNIIYNWYIAAEQLNQNEINITMVGNFMIK